MSLKSKSLRAKYRGLTILLCICIAIPSGQLGFSTKASANPVGQLQKQMEEQYRLLQVAMKDAVAAAKGLAKTEIENVIYLHQVQLYGILNTSLSKYKNKYELVRDCKNNILSIDQYLKSNHIDSEIEAVAGGDIAKYWAKVASGSRDLTEYWEKNYSAEHLIQLTDLTNSVQENYVKCLPIVAEIRSQLELFKFYQVNSYEFCSKIERDVSFDRYLSFVRIPPRFGKKLKSTFWESLPSISIGIQANIDCSHDSKSCERGMTLQSGAQYDRDAQKAQQTAQAINLLPWAITSTMYQAGILIKSMSSAFWWAAAVWLVVNLALATRNHQRMKRIIGSFNDWVRQQEKKLDDIQSQMPTRGQFDGWVAEKCQEEGNIIEKEFNETLNAFDAKTHLEQLRGFEEVTKSVLAWYNGIFLVLTANGVIDEVVADQLVKEKLAFFEPFFTRQVELEIASQLRDPKEAQGLLADSVFDCLDEPQDPIHWHNIEYQMVELMNQCELLVSSYPYQTAELPTADEKLSDIVCTYSGLDLPFSAVRVGNGSGFSSKIELLDESGQIISLGGKSQFDQVSSNDSKLAENLSCKSRAGTRFGTTADNRLKEGVYQMGIPADSGGLKFSDVVTLKKSMARYLNYAKTDAKECYEAIEDSLHQRYTFASESAFSCQLFSGEY